jgi:ABC-type lipoprotein release transport system permease subunit
MGALDLYGVDQDSFMAVRKPRVNGEFPDGPGEVLVGAVLTRNHGVVPGSVIDVEAGEQTHSLLVTGTVSCYSSYDLGLVTSKENFASFIDLRGGQPQFIELNIPDVAGFDQTIGDDYGLEVKPLMAMKDYISIVAEEIHADLTLLSMIIAVIVSLLIGHTMYKIVYDSANELHVIRCMGVTRQGLRSLILLDSTLLCLTGAFIGLVLGVVFANLLSIGVFVFLRSMYYQARFEAEIALYCLALSLFLGLLGGITAIAFVNPERSVIRGEVA